MRNGAGFIFRRRMRAAPYFVLIFAFCLLPFAFTSCSKGLKHEGPLAYVTNERDGTVTVIDTATDKVVSTFNVGGGLGGVRVGRDGELLYVAASTPSGKSYDPKENHAAVLDASTGETVATYEVGTDPEQLDVSPDGR